MKKNLKPVSIAIIICTLLFGAILIIIGILLSHINFAIKISMFAIGIMSVLMGILSICFPKAMSLPHASTVDNKLDNIIYEVKKEINKDSKENTKLKQCVFCDSLVKSDATECDSCGGKEFEKHKH